MRPLVRLATIHHRAMALRAQGLTYAAIGAEIKRSAGSVKNWFTSDPVFRAEWARMQAEARARAIAIITDAAPSAATNLVALMTHKRGDVALGASKDILDRAGLAAPTKAEHSGPKGGAIEIRVVYADDHAGVAATASGTDPDSQ